MQRGGIYMLNFESISADGMDLCPAEPFILELCAGVGGLGLGIELAVPGARPIAFVERESYAAATLAARMEEGALDPAPIWTELGSFDARAWRGIVDCVASGDPCQPNSLVGQMLGSADERFLIDQVLRIVDECRPHRLFRENVSGNADGQLAALVPALERLGYRVAAGIFSAAEVGAPHDRERLFIMADSTGARSQRWHCPSDPRWQAEAGHIAESSWWASESGLARLADGLAGRVDRTRAAGNAVVPLQAAYAWITLENLLAEAGSSDALIVRSAA
jgi:DNA (cytosine-5)-methyltransferase 1